MRLRSMSRWWIEPSRTIGSDISWRNGIGPAPGSIRSIVGGEAGLQVLQSAQAAASQQLPERDHALGVAVVLDYLAADPRLGHRACHRRQLVKVGRYRFSPSAPACRPRTPPAAVQRGARVGLRSGRNRHPRWRLQPRCPNSGAPARARAGRPAQRRLLGRRRRPAPTRTRSGR